VSVGDEVARDQPLVDIETDKSVVELPSPVAGTVLHRGATEGETLAVGEIVAVIGGSGETWAPTVDSAPAGQPAGAPAASRAAAEYGEVTGLPIVGSLLDQARDLSRPGPPAPPGQRPLALPLVRRLAASLGVDIRTVTGTGPGGRVTRADVTAAAAQPGGARDERRPLSRLRRTIATNLTRAWSEIPMVTAFDEADVTGLLAARAALQARYGMAMPIDALVLAAVVPALRAYPDFNSALDGDTLVIHRRLDIGLAVDTPDGLLVAVVVDAGSMDLPRLAAEVRRLGAAARARTLRPAERSGQTFTVSNIGAVGGGWGTPLVPLGTVAILSVGRVAPQPVARGSTVEVAPMMPLSLSYDHRVIDGAAGRRFLAVVIEHLSEPVRPPT
jgi:pyruvate dehydrogenase E2 component (dihydrolipoamide acetyltransferase)